MNRKYIKRGTFGGAMHTGKPKEEEPIGRHKCRRRNNIKTDLQKGK